MAVKGNGSVGLEVLPINSGQDPNIVGGASGGRHNAVVGIDELIKLTYDEGNRLDALDLQAKDSKGGWIGLTDRQAAGLRPPNGLSHLLSSSKKLAFQLLHLILHKILLNLYEHELRLETLHLFVAVG